MATSRSYPGAGGIVSRDAFGDAQLHVEWMAPLPAVGESQERGNSGVFLMGRYEVQVLDSYENKTYPDGQASAVYGQFPPLVNASRPPGEWQTYDIIFHRPRFDAAGKVDESGADHRPAQRGARAGQRRAVGPDGASAAAALREARGSPADVAAGSRDEGSVSEHLDPRSREALTRRA